MKWRYLKSKQFLLTWVIVYLLTPSIWTHTIVMIGPNPPVFIPFGGVYFGWHFLGELFRGDFGDAFITIFGFTLLPIIIYTFFLSVLIYYAFLKIRHKRSKAV